VILPLKNSRIPQFRLNNLVYNKTNGLDNYNTWTVTVSGIGFEVLKIALQDAVEKQQLIVEELKAMPEKSKVRQLLAEQSHLLEGTLSFLNRIT
jgi:hypothetical protein